MTELLAKAFDEASRLTVQEQDQLAAWILEELQSEERWDRAFRNSEDALALLADEALLEYQQGKTKPQSPEDL